MSAAPITKDAKAMATAISAGTPTMTTWEWCMGSFEDSSSEDNCVFPPPLGWYSVTTLGMSPSSGPEEFVCSNCVLLLLAEYIVFLGGSPLMKIGPLLTNC